MARISRTLSLHRVLWSSSSCKAAETSVLFKTTKITYKASRPSCEEVFICSAKSRRRFVNCSVICVCKSSSLLVLHALRCETSTKNSQEAGWLATPYPLAMRSRERCPPKNASDCLHLKQIYIAACRSQCCPSPCQARCAVRNTPGSSVDG